MHHATRPEDTGVVSMDRADASGEKKFAGVGYRLAAGGLGRRWTPSGEDVEEPCLEDEFVAHTARAWTRVRGLAAGLPQATRAGVSVAAGQVQGVSIAAVCQATALCALAAIGASTALYWQKSRTARVDHEIGHVVVQTADAHAQTGHLRAQWLALNDPARLQDAAARYSGLRPLAPAQFVDAGQLANHLPAPGAVPQDGGADAVPEAAVAGDAAPVFKPVTAQAASMIVPATPAQASAASHAPDIETASAGSENGRAIIEKMQSQPPAAPASAAMAHAHAATPVGDPVWDSPPAKASRPDAPRTDAPHVHAAPAMRMAMATARVPAAATPHATGPAVIRSAPGAVRVASSAVHADAKPRAMPRTLMARFDMPRWLLETHASRPSMVVMSAPPHALAVPHDSSVLEPGAKHPGEPALAVKSEARAAAPAETETQAEDDPPPAPVLRRPGYRPYYGYGYGYGYGGQYGYPYQQAPRYYANPYGGYASQPYGGGPYYQ